MFLGTHQHTLDDKGRVILPARFRERLSTTLFLTPGQEHCIDVWPLATFERHMEKLRELPLEDERFRRYHRMLTAGAFEQTPDSQGRMTIPGELRTYAGLSKDVTINGADQRVQIWDSTRWEEYRSAVEADFAGLDTPFVVPT